MQQLQPGTTLQGGKYKIEKVLGQGGFGITYLAEHDMLECKVAIKEFFFKEYCNRDNETCHVTLGTLSNRDIVDRFQNKFIKEAKTIFKLHHPNIIQIHDIFTENGTAYYVMEYIEGESLGEIVKKQGFLNEFEAVSYIKGVGKALSYIHSMSINHLDVKPGNIMLRKSDNQVILIDFGVAKQYDAETFEGTTTTPVGISHGYSPLEQYRSNGVQEFSPQSDVYALAATLFKLLTGITPPEAIEIQEEGVPVDELKLKGVSDATIHAIEVAMLSRKKRTQSIEEFINSLGHQGTVTKTEAENVIEKKEEDTSSSDITSPTKQERCKSEETVLIVDEIRSATPEESAFCEKYGLNQTEDEVVDLGLSILWCSYNAGAENPSSAGNLSAWNNIGKKLNGNHLRLPTTEEFKELKDNCNWKWIAEDKICGFLITSPTTGNKIFLRASGKDEGNGVLSSNMGFYWSNNNSISEDNAYCMTFMPGTVLCYILNSENTKMSMRYVCPK